MIFFVYTLNISIEFKNILAFCCSTPLLPLPWMIGKKMGVDIFSKENELSHLGFLFTMNQILYLLIVMWVFNALPSKMVMVYAMVFGAHLLPYSWLYKSKSYKLFAIIIPILALVIGNLFSGVVVAGIVAVTELIFVFILQKEVRIFKNKDHKSQLVELNKIYY